MTEPVCSSAVGKESKGSSSGVLTDAGPVGHVSDGNLWASVGIPSSPVPNGPQDMSKRPTNRSSQLEKDRAHRPSHRVG